MAVFSEQVQAFTARLQRLFGVIASGVVTCMLSLSMVAAAQALPTNDDSQDDALPWNTPGKQMIQPRGAAEEEGTEQEWGLDLSRLEVPLPGTVALFSLGLVCLIVGRRRTRD